MKLPDFTKHKPLDELRIRMKADLVEWHSVHWKDFDSEGLKERLKSIEGVEVDIKDIETFEDGSFIYKGQKVLVYIRDQYYFPDTGNSGYKFHIAFCETLQEKTRKRKFSRYVASTRTDGLFKVNVYDFNANEYITEDEIIEMKVCKNCLQELDYKGYKFASKSQRLKIYNEFSLSEFFQNQSTMHTVIPEDETHAPTSYK